jgi:PelA/Pel-15E family pectate lyase
MDFRLLLICLGLSLIPTRGFSAIIGTNPPALPLTSERIANLPAPQQSAWKNYLKDSEHQLRADQESFRNEMRKHKITEPTKPPDGRGVRGISLDKPTNWYAQAEALRIADIILSFQTPAGGWSKNLDMTQHRRAPGERFSTDNASRFPSSSDNDAPTDQGWNYVSTFDNDATVTQLRFLAKVIRALRLEQKDGAVRTPRPPSDKAYRAFLRGLNYVFVAQYPNGGWPQVWPLQGGYHDAITYNDNAMIQVLEFLRDVAGGTNEFAFVAVKMRIRAAQSVKRGIQCIHDTQIMVNGHRTVWCQQHDPLTHQPCSARNYEMPCESSAESAGIMQFLMKEPNPSPEIVLAIDAAAAWFEKTKIKDVAYRLAGDSGRLLVDAPGNGPLWARYYDIVTDRPIFGDRDKTIHDNVNEISKERRNGYAWYRDTPASALNEYSEWRKKIARHH